MKALYISCPSCVTTERLHRTRNRVAMMLFLGLASLLAVSCTAFSVPAQKESRLAYSNNDFSFDLLRSLKNEKNVFISPFSISTALSLVYLGADGTTEQALRSALKYDQYGLSQQEVHETYRSLLTKVKQNTDGYQFSSVNHVFVQDNFSILKSYRLALEQFYSAKIENVDFERQGEEIKEKVNEVVESATNGKIKDFLEEPPSEDAKLFLLNAVYFLGNWNKTFDPESNYERTFYNNGVQEKKVVMMFRDSQIRHGSSDELDASIVVLPYKGKDSASMVIVLPKRKTGVADLQAKINGQSLDSALKRTYVGRLELQIPKFSLSYSSNLVEPLTELGLGELFSDNANLDRIAGEHTGLKVSKVLHKAVIDVNEKGSEAAAAIGIEATSRSGGPTLSIDHPFLFFIREEHSGLILFSGRVDEL